LAFNEGFRASPANITLGVNEKVSIKVGNYDLETGEYAPVDNWFFFADRFIRFDAEVLGGNPGGVWFVNFNPPTVSLKQTSMLVTNATISLTSPPMANEPIQNTIIRITVYDTWAMKNLWWPDDRSYWPGGDNYSFLAITSPGMWFLGAVTGGFGKLSGQTLVDTYIVDVLVTVKPFHAAKIQALPPSKLSPNEITTIPVLIENQGNYNDTFKFQVRTEYGYPLLITENTTITLKPGEQGQALVGVAVPANILDTGTLHSLILETYSAEQPESIIASQRIFIETQGIYFSEENSMYLLVVMVFFGIVLLLLIRWRRRLFGGKTHEKPQKPWKIPEEQQHLRQLKRSNRDAYEQERRMMQDEYTSALLWYNHQRIFGRKKPQKEPRKQILSTLSKKVIKPIKAMQKPKKKTKEKLKKKSPFELKKTMGRHKKEEPRPGGPVEEIS
ncbi:hypothetical protein AYK25_09680, partial [Thermoplasmatales archaeon SM1-50]